MCEVRSEACGAVIDTCPQCTRSFAISCSGCCLYAEGSPENTSLLEALRWHMADDCTPRSTLFFRWRHRAARDAAAAVCVLVAWISAA